MEFGFGVYDDYRMDGGPGSGNFGHKGIKGQRGGSAPSEKESENVKEQRLSEHENNAFKEKFTKIGKDIVDLETGEARPNNDITESLKEHCKKNNISIDDNVSKVDERVTNDFQIVYDQMIQEYPVLEERETLNLKHDEMDSSGCYVIDDGYYLDRNMQNYDFMVEKSLENTKVLEGQETSWWISAPDGKEVQAVLAHELGHVIQNNMLNKFNGFEESGVYKSFMEEYFFDLSSGLDGYSVYSKSNGHENFAEGIASHVVGNRNAFANTTDRIAKNWQKVFGNIKTNSELKAVMNDSKLVEKMLKED